MIKAICVGHSTYDITVRTDEYPSPNTDIRFIKKVGCGGGEAANIAYMLCKWGMEVSLCSVIGADNYGNIIKKELQSVKADTRFLEVTYDNDTDIRMTLLNSSNSSKITYTLADNYTYLKKYDFDFTPDVIIVDTFDINAAKAVIGQYSKAIKMLYADKYSSNATDLCKKVNFIVCTKEFAEAEIGMLINYADTKTLIQAYEKLKTKYDNAQIVITLQEHGALYCINNQIKVSPAIKTDVVDTTGAGAIFRAAFIHTIANGGDIEKAVKYGNIAAGLSVSKVGGRLSVPELVEVSKLYEQNY